MSAVPKISEQTGVQESATGESGAAAAPLYLAAFLAAFCGIAYQLLLASYATFLLGASVFQYSLVISLMMASMGVGSLLSDRVKRSPLHALLSLECGLAGVAAVALPVLYFAFASLQSVASLLILGFVLLIGAGLGMEIPLLNRVRGTGEGLPRILFFDYLGGFIGGIAFPVFLVPRLGLFQTAALLSLFNALTGLVLLAGNWRHLGGRRGFWAALTAAGLGIAVMDLAFAETIRLAMERMLFGIRH